MEKRQQRTLLAFRNILIYLEQHPITPEPPLLSGMRHSLETSLDRINKLGIDQGFLRHDLGDNVPRRRQKLRREYMMPLVRIMKPLLKFAPGVERTLRVPHARADALSVANSALAMADVLEQHGKLMRSAGFPKDFLREMRQHARQLALASKRFDSRRANRSRATAAIAAEFKKAMKTVTVIEGLVMLHSGGDKSKHDHWRNRRRVSARIGRPPERGKSAAPPPA